MSEHDEPTDDITVDDVTMEGVDDELAARLRTALDSRVDPVRLDEIELRRRPSEAASSDGGGGGALTIAAVDGTGRFTEVAGGEPSGERAPHGRRRRSLLLAAAAVAVVLVGMAAVVLRDPAQDLETVAPTPAPDAGAFAEPAPGGIYDTAGGLLAGKHITAMAATDDWIILAYTRFGPLDRGPSEPAALGSVAFGVLVARPEDGSLVQDISLNGPVYSGALVAEGDRAWLAASGGTSVAPDETGALVRFDGEGMTVVDPLPNGPVTLAVGGGDLWLRRAGLLEHRDGRTGSIIESSSAGAWRGAGSVTAGATGAVWSTNLADASVRIPSVVRADGVLPAEKVVTVAENSDPQLLVSGGSLLVVESDRAARYDATDGSLLDEVGVGAEVDRFRDAAGGDGAFWLVGEDTDAQTARLGLVVIDAATGDRRSTTMAIVGSEPHIALVDAGAVVCVDVTSFDDDGSPSVGADCQRVRAPSGSEVPAVSGTSTTTSPTYWDTQVENADLATTTTTVAVPPTTTTTTAPAPRDFDPRGVTLAGLAPIRLGMTADELTAATGLSTVPVEGRCGQQGREVVGLPDGVYVVFNGDDTVRAVTIRTSAFTTVDGLSVDSTVADLLAAHPDAEAFDQITAVQYLVVAPDRSTSIAFATEADDITIITVLQGSESFMDLC